MLDNHKVLVINDSLDQLELLGTLLKKAGFNVLTASGGREGYTVAQQEQPDLIISDVMMPDGDGMELCRLVRADANLRFTPILLISALLKDTASVIQGLEAGADDYMESPYQPMHLIAKAARLIERKRLEDTLRQSENRFRSLIENLTDIISIIAPDGTIIYESPSIENAVGFKAEELIGKSAFDYIHPDDISAVISYFGLVLRKRNPARPIEYRFLHKDGFWRTVESVVKPFIDPNVGLVTILNSRDVTNEKETLKAKRESEKQFQAIFDNSAIGIALVNAEKRLIQSNPALQKMLGYTDEELRQRSFIEITHPDDAAADVALAQEIFRGERDSYQLEKRYLKKNGETAWGNLTMSAIRSQDGELQFVVGMVKDITDRREAETALRESEESYRIVAETASDAIITIDNKSHIIFINPAGEKIFGYSADEMIGQPLSMLMPERLRSMHSAGHQRYVSTRERRISWDAVEVVGLRRNGEEFPLELSFGEYEGGKHLFIAVARDVSDRKRAEAALRESEDRFKAQYKGMPIPTGTWKKAGDDFVLVDYNDAAEKLTKGGITGLIGISASELYRDTPHIAQSFHRCFNEQTTVRHETPFWMKTTGELKHLDMSFVFVPSNMVMVHYRDVTGQIEAQESLKQSDERFQLVARATNDSLWDTNLVTGEVWLSGGFYSMFGDSPEELEPTSQLWEERLHPDDRKRAADVVKSALQSGENYWTAEYRFRRADGTYAHVLDRAYVVYNDDGKPLRMIGAMMDITGRKLVEDALRSNEARLQKQNNVLNELAKRHKLFRASLQTAIREITEVVAQTLEVERVGVWLHNEDKTKIRAVDIYELSQNRHAEGLEVTEADYPVYFEALAGEIGIAAHDAQTDPRTGEFAESYLIPLGITSMLDTPIRVGGRVVGVICHEHTGDKREWKLDEQSFAGSMASLISLLLEANERRQAEDALRRSQQQYASLIDSVEGIVWEADAKTFQFTFVSKQAERLLGYPLEQWTDEPTFWVDHVHPEDREATVNFCKTAVEKLENHEFDYRMADAEGRIVWLHDIVTVDVLNKDDVRLRGVMVDVTANKEAEAALAEANERAIREYDRLLQRLTLLAQASGAARDLLTVFSAILDFTLASVPCSALFISLYNEADSTRKLAYLWHNGKEEDVSKFDAIHVGEGSAGRAIKTGEAIIENDFQKASGKKPTHVRIGYDEDPREPHSTLITPMKIKGDVIGTIEVQSYDLNAYTQEHATAMQMAANLVANSIENVRLLEQEQRNAEQLRQSQKLESVGRLAGGIAHDFNNMLTVINCYSDLALVKLGKEDPIRWKIEEIKKAGERSAALTHQLLAFSRQQFLSPKLLDINEIVIDISKMLQRLIGEDVQFSFLPDPKIGKVEVDPGQLTQVIMNLAVNARDAMPHGGILTVETADIFLDEEYASRHISTRPGSYVMLAVSDTGIGMDEETRQQIFEPFFTTKEVGQGTGLGLATVYGIVNQSGGYIWVYSEVGKGTTFKIYFPLAGKKVELPAFSDSLESIPTGTETILLVEDEKMVRGLARQILETCGYKVIEAANGTEAVEICEKADYKIDLLLTDVIMPKMGGRELAEKVLQINPSISLLYMSGYTDDAVLRQGVIDVDTNFIQKPFTFKSLSQKVRKILDAKNGKH